VRAWPPTRRGRWGLVLLLAAPPAGALWFAAPSRAAPDVPTAQVVRGEFVDVVELRGDVRPVKSLVLSAPMQAGELQIVRLAPTGTTVEPGDVIVQFDSSTLRRTIQEKRTELKQAEAEIDQARAQARITEEQSRTALMRARFDVQRATLDLVDDEFVARLVVERAKLALADAEQRLREAEQKNRADRAATEAQIAGRERRRHKVRQDLTRAEQSLAALQIRAPAKGTVSILPNFRAGSMFGSEQEFRDGDRAWAGAPIVELPDLSSVRLSARLEEADRARVQVGQRAVVRVDAVPDTEFRGAVAEISVLARVDHTSGWPPSRDFDLLLTLENPDARLRPGMSAMARIAVDRLPDRLLVPAEAVFLVDGRPTVYRWRRGRFEASAVDVVRRGREQVALAAGVDAGDRLALKRPDPKDVRTDR
jgi:multidrug efflux pump subunit AcrA (membrane-fusion protein)